MDDAFALGQLPKGVAANWVNWQSLQLLDRVRLAMSRHEVEILAVVSPKCTVCGVAQAQRLFEHRVEHRREIAG